MITKQRLDEIASGVDPMSITASESIENAKELSEFRKLVANNEQKIAWGGLYCGACGYAHDLGNPDAHSPDCIVLKYADYKEVIHE
jgi:hypothetical protein